MRAQEVALLATPRSQVPLVGRAVRDGRVVRTPVGASSSVAAQGVSCAGSLCNGRAVATPSHLRLASRTSLVVHGAGRRYGRLNRAKDSTGPTRFVLL